jgi:tetratricopeptide (TPR) repeat protein
MPSRLHLVALLVAACFVAGCSAVPSQRAIAKKGKAANSRAEAEEDRSPEAIERRTEAHARYAAGVVLDLNDNPEAAVEEYFKAALADVRDEQLVLEVTRRLLQLRQQDKALELLKKATDDPNSSGQLFARLGMVYSLTGRKEEALEANRTAIRKSPQSLSGYQNLVHIHLQAREPEEAMKVLEQAAKQPNAEPVFLVEVADLYAAIMRGGGDDAAKAKALEMLGRADKLNPVNPLLQQKLADSLAALGETERAADLYLKLLEKYPNLPTLRQKLIDLYIRNKDKKKAVEQLEAIVRTNPTSAQAYYMLGSLAFEDKDYKKAAEHLNKALLLAPNFEQLYYDLAGAQVNLNESREALQTLEKARGKFAPSFVNEYFTAMAYSRMKDHTNALKHLVAAEVVARATDTNRLTHGFYFQLGAAYERTQSYSEAERYFRRCLQMDPKFSEALNYLGYMWAERGTNLDEARQLIEKAVELEPKNAAYLDSLGWVLYKLDRSREALVWLQKAIEHTEEPDATLYDHLGDVYSSLDKHSEAREAWRKAVSIQPNLEIEKKLGGSATVSPGDK